jgi:hypothetical protein
MKKKFNMFLTTLFIQFITLRPHLLAKKITQYRLNTRQCKRGGGGGGGGGVGGV